MELEKEIFLEAFLHLLGEKYPVFGKNFIYSLGAREDVKKVRIPLLIMINNKSSGLNQTIKQGDVIEVFLIAAGG
ncbi:hypothetical protein ES703_31114 [subsurface metagenome]